MQPLFTIFIDAYHGPELLRRSAQSVLEQTYSNVELIIVDNGALAEVREEIKKITDVNQRVRVVRFEENQFSWDDPHIVVDVCWNAALRESQGEFIFHLSYDDFLSPDYAARMVALFEEKPECTSAAGAMVNVDIDGVEMENNADNANNRPRYMLGHLLALDTLEGGDMFAAAGDIFSFRRRDLVAAGGYHKSVEDSQLYGLVPLGTTGFDSQAKLYWCRHEGQLNRRLMENGWTGFIAYTEDLLRNWNIEERWERFGANTAKMVAQRLLSKEWRAAGAQAAALVSELNIRAFLRMSRAAGFNRIFWQAFWCQMWSKRRQLLSNILTRLGLKTFLLHFLNRRNADTPLGGLPRK